MSVVRRCLAILLLLAFGLPLVSAAMAATGAGESQLPACCRRMGAHHCAMTMGERQAVVTEGHHWQAPRMCCPYCPAAVASVHADPLAPPGVAQAVFAELIRHPTLSPQTESRRRIARDRARQKRGPPPSHLL